MVITLAGCGGSPEEKLDKEIETAVGWVKEMTPAPSLGSVGGEWAVKGVEASGITDKAELQEYFDVYYDDVRAKSKAYKGVLDKKYYTEYARVSIGLGTIGKNPEDVEGYNLFKPLDNYSKVTDQGINAVTFALIASNVTGLKLNNEEKYIDLLIEEIEKNKLYDDERSVDYTAMCMEGLSYYKEDKNVQATIDKCIDGLAKLQGKDGSYGNCEATAEVIMALTSVGVDPINDERFIKDDNSLFDGLMEYKSKEGYVHTKDAGENANINNLMPTEKALLALDSMKLFQDGKKLFESGR